VTSPYLIDEAKKLKLGQDRIATGAKADHRARDFRFSRTQREAGIEHLEWEHRLPALRPWMFFAISAICWVVLAVGIAWTMAAL
jgi:hypothetical protein